MKLNVVAALAGFILTGMVADAANPVPVAGDAASPGFRGPAGSGLYRGAAPASWSEKDKKGILWQAKLELPGWSSPVVWSNTAVVTSADTGRRLVYGFDAVTGKQVWKTEVPVAEGAAAASALDTQSDQWNEMLHAGATPATDGKQVYAVFSNGQLVALDLATGKHLWSVVLGDTTGNTYGQDSSLLVHDGSVIVAFQGAEQFIAAYETATGKQRWKTRRDSSSWASPILVKTQAGGTLVVLPGDPDVTAWDARTGDKAWSTKVLTTTPEYCVGASPVSDGERIYVVYENSGIFALDPGKGTVLWKVTELPDGSSFSSYQSMTTDGQRLYHFAQSVLTVLDAKSGKVLGQSDMEGSSSEASPMVVGNILYLICGDTVIVARTGDKPEKLGEGTVNEPIYASPAYAAGRVFLRASTVLYCIGQ